MDMPEPTPPQQALQKLPRKAQWALLLVLSAVITILFELLHLPAALLIGPMIAAIIAGVNGATLRVPKLAFATGQSVVGCLVAASVTTDIFTALVVDWPLVLISLATTLAGSSFLGWFISRLRILPGTTAVWGSSPGAATAMVLMADAFGADSRLVAFMQYLRVIMVSLSAALIARLWVDTSGVTVPVEPWFPALDPQAFGATVLVVVVGGTLGTVFRLPSAHFLGSMIVGAIVSLGFGIQLQLPEWLLGLSYVAIAWTIGLNFTLPILRHAARALPQVVASILALMALCGGLAWILSHELGVDPLTAYLATSPGGMDSVAIIAAASGTVDMSFVMALQAARFLFVLLFGPMIAKLIARTIRPE